MVLDNVVIASLSAAEESLGFTRKSASYLHDRYGLHMPDIEETIIPDTFSGGEFNPMVKSDIKGKNVYLFAVPTNPVNLLFYVSPGEMKTRAEMAASVAKEYGAKYVTLVAPDLFFSRADKSVNDLPPDASKDKIDGFMGKGNLARVQASAFKVAGIDRVVTLHLHSQRVAESYQKVYGRNDALVDLSPTPLLCYYLIRDSMIDLRDEGRYLVLIGPDAGVAEFVLDMQRSLAQLGYGKVSTVGFIKVRTRPNDPNKLELKNPTFSENYEGLQGKTAMIIDDGVDTGGTQWRGFNTLLDEGLSHNGGRLEKPKSVSSFATNAGLSGIRFRDSMRLLVTRDPIEILFTNTHPFVEDNMIYELKKKGTIIRTAWYLGEKIRCQEEGIPIEDSYKTNGIPDLQKIRRFMPPPYRRTEHPLYGNTHSR